MRIHRDAFNIIAKASVEALNCEIGGILGADASGVIQRAVVDYQSDDNQYFYTPNVDWLNEVIAQWNELEFIGLFHSHWNNQSTLSAGDREYIREIMNAMPPDVLYLYFPIFVMPEKKLYAYKAIRNDGGIIIREEPIEILLTTNNK